MEQKDFILREIEKISALLLAIIGKFIPSKSIEEQQQTEKLISDQLEEQYGKDLNYVLKLKEKDFETEFTRNKGFTIENIELLADLLYTLGNDNFEIKINYLTKSVELYKYIDTTSKTFSFERLEKIRTIKDIL
jgi:hypothetical protein